MQAFADVLVPYVLAEALKEPSAVEINQAIEQALRDYFVPTHSTIKLVFANRLKSLAAAPDPAIDALRDAMKQYGYTTEIDRLEAFVAAVDNARKDAGK
jgi:hypothetical protein